MEVVRCWTDRDLRRLDEIIVEGERRFKERQPRSGALIGKARGVLAGGATSSWQIARPQMIWVSHGEGSRIYDADGGEYVDLHGGYGVGAVGHGHPRIVEEYDLVAYTLAFGAKGSVTFSGRRVRNYRDFLELDDRLSQAHWLFQHNGGVFLPPWGKAEQWTLSVQHSENDARRFVDNFGAFARALRK